MNLKIYAIQDARAGSFLTPFFSHNDGTAVRQVAAAVVDKDSLFHKFPEDYTLYCVGEWMDDTGTIMPEIPHTVMSCLDMKLNFMVEIEDA